MFGKVLVLTLLLGFVTADEFGIKYIMRVYEDCQNSDIIPCLKRKAILFFDRAAKMDSIPLIDGVEAVKLSNVDLPSENEILPRSLGSKDEALSEILWNRIAAFANSRSIQLSLPKVTGEELNKGVEEGRGKMKKMMGMMMMGAAMKMAAMIPVAIAGLFILAGKALIVSKIALLLAGILALKKLIAAKNSGGASQDSHSSHGWSSGGASGGWDRRSYNDASDVVYSAYKKD
ncbi:unnamed protein product [Pieris brassicae]|uniref:Uncharacterized protein n=1 Tax=Pieris brassicae TaxID=7116 RepID=A0A9P0U0C1_PIEBR|nr:unnamed protein product [Pieris brassicae]